MFNDEIMGRKKKGQMGETVTWIVATVIIIFILIFFIFGASLLGSTKNVKVYRKSLVSPTSYQGDDYFLKASFFAFFKTDSNILRKRIQEDLWKMEEEGKFHASVNDTRLEFYRNLGRTSKS